MEIGPEPYEQKLDDILFMLHVLSHQHVAKEAERLGVISHGEYRDMIASQLSIETQFFTGRPRKGVNLDK